MEYLFDSNKPHFKVWLTIHDMDVPNFDVDATFFMLGLLDGKSPVAPLYYAALCGFRDLVEYLITKHPQDVNADGGYYVRPLVAALAGDHFQTADLLRRNGADLDVRGTEGRNPLHAAAFSGNFEVVRKLIEYDHAAINAGDRNGWTPLHWASVSRYFKDGSVFRLLLEHGADMSAQTRSGQTLLHVASTGGLEAVRLLLELGADVEAEKDDGETALQVAAKYRFNEALKILLEHGAK
jgi:ankyrin repeat protein